MGKLDVIVRKTVKKALGLPVRTHTENLLALGVHNSTAETAEAQQRSQLARLSTTMAGRRILGELGFNPMELETNNVHYIKTYTGKRHCCPNTPQHSPCTQ